MAKKSVLDRVEGSLERLIADHSRLVEVCRQLTEQQRVMQSERRELQQQIIELERELSKLQLCQGLAGADKSRDRAKARVNRLMREVDRCIALLNTPDDESNAEAAEAVEIEDVVAPESEVVQSEEAEPPAEMEVGQIDMELEFHDEINDK